MSISSGLERTWQGIQSGWRTLMERASNALTRFMPGEDADQDDRSSAQLRASSPSWGLIAAEMKETAKDVVVRIEAPGMDPDKFDIEVRDQHLVVRGEKRIERDSDEGRYHVTERAYGYFERILPLPAEVEGDKAKASYKRGVLTVRLPKHESAITRKISVQGR